MRSLTRRAWLSLSALAGITRCSAARRKPLEPAACTKRGSEGNPHGFAGTVRDRLWISVATGQQAMTPAESALYLGVPNVILTRSAGGPPLGGKLALGHQLALSLSGFTRVVWPTEGHEHLVGVVRPLLAEFPNFKGVLLDGVLLDTALQPMLAELHQVKTAIGHRVLVVNVYAESLNAVAADNESLQAVNVVVLWPGNTERLEHSLTRLERLAPAADIMLGCSLQGDSPRQITNRIQGQGELALKWIRGHRVAGLVFGAGAGIVGDSEAGAYLRQWISAVAGERL